MNIVKTMTGDQTADEQREQFEIGELARELGVSTRTIRFYEEKGIVSPERKGTTRIFNRRDRARLVLAMRGKRLGFSLDVIKEYLELYNVRGDTSKAAQREYLTGKINDALDVLEKQKEEIDTTISELKEMKKLVRKPQK